MASGTNKATMPPRHSSQERGQRGEGADVGVAVGDAVVATGPTICAVAATVADGVAVAGGEPRR